MRVSVEQEEERFDPIYVEIKFETKEEFLAFDALVKTNLSVPIAVANCYCTVSQAQVREVLNEISAKTYSLARSMP